MNNLAAIHTVVVYIISGPIKPGYPATVYRTVFASTYKYRIG